MYEIYEVYKFTIEVFMGSRYLKRFLWKIFIKKNPGLKGADNTIILSKLISFIAVKVQVCISQSAYKSFQSE